MSEKKDQQRDEFINLYVDFAHALIEFEKKQRTDKKSLTSLLLLADWPQASAMQEVAAIGDIAKQLFRFHLRGLTSSLEIEPWTYSIGLAFALGGTLEFEQNKEIIWRKLLYPLKNINPGYDLNITDETIRTSVGFYYDAWNQLVWPYEAIIPLHNFDSEIDDIKIGSLRLKSIDTLPQNKALVDRIKADRVRFVLVSDLQYYGGNTDAWNSLINDLNDGVTALRLMLPEQYEHVFNTGVGLSNIHFIPGLYCQELRYTSKVALQIRVEGTAQSYFVSNGFPKLTAEHVPALERYFISKNDTLSALTFALKRFNLSYSRETEDDRLIDLTIALETCLVPDGKEGEIIYKLGVRASLLLNHRFKAEYIKSLISVTYDVRSKIAHQGKHFYDVIDKAIPNKLLEFGIVRATFLSAVSEIVRTILLAEIEVLYSLSNRLGRSPNINDLTKHLDKFLLVCLDNPPDLSTIQQPEPSDET